MVRIIVDFALAAIFVLLAMLTAVNPQWIEAVFGVEPDGGSGGLEWITVAVFGAVAVVAAGLGTRTAVLRSRSASA